MPSLLNPSRFSSLLLALLLGLLGCQSAGTSTGNPSPGDGTPDSGLPDGGDPTNGDNDGLLGGESGYCEAGESTEIGVDEESELGFSAADILAFAAGTHEETIRWNEQMNGTLSPETGEHTITITLTHDGGDVRYVLPSTENNGGQEILIDIEGPGCTPWLEIDVHVTVETDGGALDESFDATLRSRNVLVATLFTHPDPDDLGGDFTVTDITPAGFELTQLDLGITFSQIGVNGSFGGVLTMETSDAVTAGAGGDFADFGDASCGNGNLAVGLDDELAGTSLQAMLDAFAAHPEVEIEWEDATSTTSTLTFTPSESAGCALLDNYAGGTQLTILGALAMTSEDGRLDGNWSGTLQASVIEDGQLVSIDFLIEGSGLPDVDQPGAVAAYGFPMEDVTGFDSAGIGVSVMIENSGSPTGTVSLTGYTLAECAGGDPDDPNADPPADEDPDVGGGTGGAGSSQGGGSAGCRGSDPTVLASGTIN